MATSTLPPLPTTSSQPSPQVRASAEQEIRRRRKLKELESYQYDAAGFIRKYLRWIPWRGSGPDKPGQVEILEAYNLALRQMHEKRDYENGNLAADDLIYWRPGQTIQNVIRIEAGHTVGKTKVGSGIARHFLSCFAHSLVYTYAPSWESVKHLIWKEIKTDDKGSGLPGRLLENCEIKIAPDWFALGKSTNDAGGAGTERVQGNHGTYLLFMVDEAEGVAEYVIKAIETMRGGGIVIVVLFANPRTRTSWFHKYASLSYVKSFRISCLNAPNVVAGREVVPNAVKRDYVLSMVEKHCEWVAHENPDDLTFTLAFAAVAKNSNGILMPPGTHFKPDNEFSFRVLGIAPPNSSDNTLVPTGRFEAAVGRVPVSHRPHEARVGVDVARWGNDAGTMYVRHDGRVWREAQLVQQDSGYYCREIKALAKKLAAKGVTSFHVRIDGGGGFGSGVIDGLRRDDELRRMFKDFKVLEVHNNGVPHDEKAYRNLGTEMYAEAAESMLGLSIVDPPEHLESDLCERTYNWVNLKGIDVKILQPKSEFKKDKGHSPDDGDGFVLACSPDFIFKPKLEGYNPAAMIGGVSRRNRK